MNAFEAELELRLEQIRAGSLYRSLRRVDSPQSARIQLDGRRLVNFSSNDYLGLANDPEIKAGAKTALEKYGSGSGASRLISGSLAPHFELEEALADFKGTEAALTFSSGYATAVGAICALLGHDDVIILDKLVHACIVDAARLSGAKIRVFSHNDLDELRDLLRWAREKHLATADSPGQVMIATESVFSMDGDHAPLADIVELKDQFGAWLLVDEAHATGLYGANRRGWAEECGVSDRIEIQMGTLGKALGSAGGYIAGSRKLIDLLINKARSFIFSTAPVPAASAAARGALAVVKSERGQHLRDRLWQNVGSLPWQRIGRRTGQPSAIVPVILGQEQRALEVADALLQAGFLVPAIRYPTVARGQARLRISFSASHTAADLQLLGEALESVLPPAANR